MINHIDHNNLSRHSLPEDLFCECYTQFRDEICTYLLELTGDSNQASDLTQNVFLKFWTLKDNYSRIGDAKAYLKRMAGNAFRDTGRQDKKREAYINAVSCSTTLFQHLTERMFDDKELQRTFQQTILDLSKQRRIVFVLFQIEGRRRKKIAGRLGISPFTVKVTLQNALREMRKKCGTIINFNS
jgi:RNA polymerase sigma-70 factor (ECF subfamily)